MTISAVQIRRLRLPLHEPFVISLGPIESVENIIVTLQTVDGFTGWGECSPYLTINGESIDTCAVVGGYFAKALPGQNATDIEGCLRTMDSIIYGNSSIKSAFDMALHDLAAQYAGLPLYAYLGGANRVLQTDMTVSLGTPQKMAADARRFQEAGFPSIKVKLGENQATDVARIRAIREAIGPAHPLHADANQGWDTPERAIAVLQALAPYHLLYCEEPIARWRFMELRQVAEASPIPIMADECCSDHHDAERLIQLKACSLINIKLGKSGGLHNGLKMARLGERHGVDMQVGGFMESRLGVTANAHLALASPAVKYCDFDTPLMYTHDPVLGGIIYGERGTLQVSETPGLGATIDEAYLE